MNGPARDEPIEWLSATDLSAEAEEGPSGPLLQGFRARGHALAGALTLVVLAGAGAYAVEHGGAASHRAPAVSPAKPSGSDESSAASGAALSAVACPSFPAEPARPVFDGPPLPLAVLLRPADLARLGRGWQTLGDAHRAVLPVYGSEDRDPVLPADQQSALYFQLSSGDRAGSSIQETVIRYAGGTGRTAAGQWAAQLACGDGQHSVRVLYAVDVPGGSVRAYARLLRVATPALAEPPVVDAWEAVVRWQDVVAVLVVRGGLANDADSASAAELTRATLTRLRASAGE